MNRNFNPEAAARGRAIATAARRAERAARIEDYEWLIESGVPAHEAAIRAGWPTVASAARAMYRVGHPAATLLERLSKQQAAA
ncbi:hypothetical protein AB0284_21475 [Pseudarthrobacter phenanthrenivorans]|uniref:hypothetical protein n=1 Tax=Pseudarthrobacter phenanthrenivorans TaxID=361575 RepID=UPI003450725F